jgi:hypothetical protein
MATTNSTGDKIKNDNMGNSGSPALMMSDSQSLIFADDTASVFACHGLSSPVFVKWTYFHNKARLRWGIAKGFGLENSTVSHRTGLMVFPGMDDEGFIMEAALDPQNYA